MTINQTGDDYEVYSVIKDNNKSTSRSDMTNIRSKSAKIGKGYSESEVRFKKQNYFGKNATGTEIESLGFTKDFLDFDTKSPALLMSHKNEEIDVSKRYENVDFSKLQDLDFTSNRPNNNLMANLKPKNANNLNIIDEVNEKDYETPKYPNFEFDNAKPKNKAPPALQEESLLDL